MAQIPPNSVSYKDIQEWEALKSELARIKVKEMLLRTKIFGGLFPNAAEGVNYYNLLNGYRLKATAVITRDVDEALWTASKEQFKELKINENLLIKKEPKLIIKAYRSLTEDQRKIVDAALIIKDGAPQMTIVAPRGGEEDGTEGV